MRLAVFGLSKHTQCGLRHSVAITLGDIHDITIILQRHPKSCRLSRSSREPSTLLTNRQSERRMRLVYNVALGARWPANSEWMENLSLAEVVGRRRRLAEKHNPTGGEE